MVKPSEKGSEFEWKVARILSAWLHPDGATTELIRSTGSGGWGQTTSQLADIAPNGEYGGRFCEQFVVECKHWKEIDWWWYFTAPNNELYKAWVKIRQIAQTANVVPLFIIRRNHRPILVGYPYPTLFADGSVSVFSPSQPGPPMVLTSWQCAFITLDQFMTMDPEWYYEWWTPKACWG